MAGAAIALGYSWSTSGIVYDLLRPDSDATTRLAALQSFFARQGPLAPVLYVAFVIVEVVIAPIPGLLLYAPGGMLFGPWWGGTLSLIGNVLGAGLACALTRTFGETFLRRMVASSALDPIQKLLERRGGWIILALRANPLTSSDLVSYAAGFTRIRVSVVMLATGIGMAPLCYVQAYLSDSIFRAFPIMIYPLLALCLLYALAMVIMVFRSKRPVANSQQQ